MNNRQGQTEGSAKTSFTVRFFMFKIILFLLFLNNLLLHLFFHLRLKLILDGLLKKKRKGSTFDVQLLMIHYLSRCLKTLHCVVTGKSSPHMNAHE